MADFQIEPLPGPDINETTTNKFLGFFNMATLKYVIGIVVILAAVSIFFIFFRRSSFSDAKVDVSMDTPAEISAGDLVTFTIKYQNNNKEALTNAVMRFYYPVDAIAVKDGQIVQDLSETVNLDQINGGTGGEQKFQAYVIGESGNIKNAKVTLTFGAQNLTSTFEREAISATTITAVDVPLTVVAPPTVINGQSMTYTIDYRNQSSSNLSDLRLNIKYPDGFKVTKTVPDPSGDTYWDIPSLAQQAGSRINISGTLSGNEQDEKDIIVTLQKKITTPDGGETYLDFEKTQTGSVISSSPLGLGIKVNDSADYVARLGETLNYTITYRNGTNVDLTGLQLAVHLNGSMYDYNSVYSQGFFDSGSDTITWDVSSVPEFGNLHPNQSGTVNFRVNLKNKSQTNTGTGDTLVKATAIIMTNNVPPNFSVDSLSSQVDVITKISSDPSLSQKVLINDSVYGSSGPFPPKVGSKTNFTIHWIVTNPTNALNPAQVTATLPTGVEWVNQSRTSSGLPTPSYDSRLRKITWDMGNIAGGTGSTFDLYFLVSATPSSSQVGQAVTLLKDVEFDATDSVTGEKIVRTLPDPTSVDAGDYQHSGIVVP